MRGMTIAPFTLSDRGSTLHDRTDLVLDEANLAGMFEMA